MTPKVKPLVWVKWKATEIYSADSIFGEYRISLSPVSGLWDAGIPGIGFSTNDTLELAQAAAQADYDARIIAALDPAWLAALEAQVKAVAEWHDARTAILAADQSDTATLPAMVTRLANAEWTLVTAYRTAKEASYE